VAKRFWTPEHQAAANRWCLEVAGTNNPDIIGAVTRKMKRLKMTVAEIDSERKYLTCPREAKA
jgi:glycine cleavage system regulatory protein